MTFQRDEPPDDRFATLYERHATDLLGYLLRRTDQPADAADLLAEVFVVVWRRIDDLPAEPETRPWLFGTARRVLATHRRGSRRRHAMADALRSELSVWPTADTLPEPDPALKNALAVLAEEDRELLTMIAWDGLSPTEAAAVLGIEPGAARVRLHRARRRLERLLGATGDREGSSAMTVRPTVAAPAPSTSHPHAADHRDGPSAVATPFDPRTTATHETTAADRPSPPTSHGDSRPAATADRHQHRTPTPTPATAAHP